MAGEMLEQQRGDPLRHLVCGVVANAGKSLEGAWRGDELSGSSAAALPTV
jgi:hypothetical protein